MASPISKILKSFSKNFGTFAAGMSAWMMANIHGDDDVEGKVDAMWKAMGVGAYVGDSVRNSMLSAYEKGAKKTISLLPSALEEAWDESGMTLSEKLHGADKEMRDRIVQTIRAQLKLNRHAMTAARELYDGYNSGKAVTRRQSIPKYLQKVIDFARRSDLIKEDEAYLLRMVRRAQRQVDKLAADGAPNRALKSAYSELLTAVSERSEKAMQRAVHTAIEEKSRYIAERIARTEAARAWADGFVERYGHDGSVVAYQWKLSSRHPKFDICNLYAEANLWGLGNGIYPKDETPKLPVHPHCLCHLAPVFSSELDKKPTNRIEAGGREYLNQLSHRERMQLMGVEGAKAFEKGVDWRKSARNYSSATLKSSIIKQSGALNPESGRAFKHAARYYESVRHMKTDYKRIAANTGFRAQDILSIKKHVFMDKHELLNGYDYFYPSYQMSQSWQRLIDGRNIRHQDVIMLNHEFLECTLMKQGMKSWEAHDVAQGVYDYSSVMEDD